MTTTSLSGSIIQPGLPLRFLSRVRLNFTSSAVNGLPLANFTFGRSLNVYSLPSGDTFHSVARIGQEGVQLLRALVGDQRVVDVEVDEGRAELELAARIERLHVRLVERHDERLPTGRLGQPLPAKHLAHT